MRIGPPGGSKVPGPSPEKAPKGAEEPTSFGAPDLPRTSSGLDGKDHHPSGFVRGLQFALPAAAVFLGAVGGGAYLLSHPWHTQPAPETDLEREAVGREALFGSTESEPGHANADSTRSAREDPRARELDASSSSENRTQPERLDRSNPALRELRRETSPPGGDSSSPSSRLIRPGTIGPGGRN